MAASGTDRRRANPRPAAGRRRFLRQLVRIGAGVAGLALVGCGADDDGAHRSLGSADDEPTAADDRDRSGNPAASALPRATAEAPVLSKTAELPAGHVTAIAFAPSAPDVAYLSINVNAMGVWRSRDGGQTWQRVFYDGNFGATHSHTVAVHPLDADVVLVGDLHGRVSRSADGGDSWQGVYEGHAAVWSLAFGRGQPDAVYAGTSDGTIVKSDDGGRSWSALPASLPSDVGCVAVGGANGSEVLAGTRQGLYASPDGGTEWQAVFPSELRGLEVVDVAVRDDGVALAATPDGVFRRQAGDGAWTGVLPRHAHAVEFAPGNPTVAYAGTSSGAFRSDDAGQTWVPRHTGAGDRDIGALAVHAIDPDIVLTGSNIWQWTFHHDPFPASTAEDGVYRSDDGGQSWHKTTSIVDRDVIAVAVDPSDPDLVYAGTECSRGLYQSEDGGASWRLMPGGAPENPDAAHYSMVLGVDAESRVYLTGRFGFSHSDAHAARWAATAPVRRHFHGLGLSPHDVRLIFVGTSPRQDPTETEDWPGGRILRSVDRGRTWEDVGPGFPSGAPVSVHDFAFDCVDPQIVYAATTSHEFGLPRTPTTRGLFRSEDQGDTWVSVNDGLSSLEVEAVAASPITGGLVFAGTDDGLFRSEDHAAHWDVLPLAQRVRSLLLDPAHPEAVYAGTVAGLYWSPDLGASWQQLSSVPPTHVTAITMDRQGSALYAAVDEVGVFRRAMG